MVCFRLLWGALQGLGALSYVWAFLLQGSEDKGLPMSPAPRGLRVWVPVGAAGGWHSAGMVFISSPAASAPLAWLLPVSLAKALVFFPQLNSI